jgi:hypothetical protein
VLIEWFDEEIADVESGFVAEDGVTLKNGTVGCTTICPRPVGPTASVMSPAGSRVALTVSFPQDDGASGKCS